MKTSGVLPIFIAGGIAGQVLFRLPPTTSIIDPFLLLLAAMSFHLIVKDFELYLYALKFVVETFIVSAQRRGAGPSVAAKVTFLSCAHRLCHSLSHHCDLLTA